MKLEDNRDLTPRRVVEMLAHEQGLLTPSGMLLLAAPPRGADRIQDVANVLRRILGRSAA